MDVFDWVSPARDEFTSYPLTSWEPGYKPHEPPRDTAVAGWWPGVYRGEQGDLRAFNTLDLHFQSASQADWRVALERLAAAQKRGVEMTQALLIASLTLATLAALVWKKRDNQTN